MNKIIFFKTPINLRKWFKKNHETEKELFVGYYKVHTKKPSITWSQSVDEAICFGWIDGIRNSIDDESYQIDLHLEIPKAFGVLLILKNLRL